jgi:hypothetical protein
VTEPTIKIDTIFHNERIERGGMLVGFERNGARVTLTVELPERIATACLTELGAMLERWQEEMRKKP